MRIVATLLLCLSLAACVTSPTQRDPLKQKVSVSVSGPTMPVTRNTPLSWYSDVISINDTGNAVAPDKALASWVKGEVQQQMEARGFVFSDSATRYQVVNVLLLGEGDISQSTQQLFKLFPALQGDSRDYPKGTILLGILDTRLNKAVWRSALQTFATPDADEQQKHERLSAAVTDTLRDLKPGR
ncbi:MAG: hypothetical protein ACRBBW_10260 [Cellvibrionaceae bacterium]